MTINERLKSILDDRGVKQAYISQKTGFSADVISRILKGNRKILADEFLTICNALSIDPNSFREQ